MLTDAQQIAEVHRLSRAEYYGLPPDENDEREAMWKHFLCEMDRITYVVENSGVIVAVMSARHLNDPVAACEMTAIYVHPQHFGRGVGSRLYDAFEDERRVDEAGVLEVWAGNHRAIEFYQRRGWTLTPKTRVGPQDIPFVTYCLVARRPAG